MSRLIAVTGGAGYIGVNLVEQLVARGERVRVIDRFFWGKLGLDELPGVELLSRDVRELQDGDLEGVDAVCHLAGLSNDPTADLDPNANWQMNMIATKELADAAIRMGVRRITFGSSGSIYDGAGSEQILDEDAAVAPARPLLRIQVRRRARAPRRAGQDRSRPPPAGHRRRIQPPHALRPRREHLPQGRPPQEAPLPPRRRLHVPPARRRAGRRDGARRLPRRSSDKVAGRVLNVVAGQLPGEATRRDHRRGREARSSATSSSRTRPPPAASATTAPRTSA